MKGREGTNDSINESKSEELIYWNVWKWRHKWEWRWKETGPYGPVLNERADILKIRKDFHSFYTILRQLSDNF